MNLEELNQYIKNHMEEQQQTSTIRGLHTCAPGNTPSVGQIKLFSVEERQGKSGKPWTKIRNDDQGQPYMVMSVAKTDWQNDRGMVSFNLEIEPAAHAPVQQQPHQSFQNAPQTHSNGPVTGPVAEPKVMDTPRQHLMRAANLYCLCIDAVDVVVAEKMRKKNIDPHEHLEFYQAAVSTLFIDAQRAGYVQHMPASGSKPKSEPF